jgi:hypothetical protein
LSAPAAADIAALNEEFGIPGRVEVVAGRGGLPTVVLKHACGASAEVTLFGGCITSWKQPSGDEVLFMRPDALKVLEGPDPRAKPISGGIPHCFPQVRQAIQFVRLLFFRKGSLLCNNDCRRHQRLFISVPGSLRPHVPPASDASLQPRPAPPPPAPQFGPGAMQQHGFARNVDWSIAATSADPQPDDQDPEVTLVLADSDYTRSMWCARLARAPACVCVGGGGGGVGGAARACAGGGGGAAAGDGRGEQGAVTAVLR